MNVSRYYILNNILENNGIDPKTVETMKIQMTNVIETSVVY
jgi:hypothetical protein